jgi:translation initiation factor IF-1
MGKNLFGGNKRKRQKNSSGHEKEKQEIPLINKNDKDHVNLQYAVVLRNLGGGHFNAVCSDGIQRMIKIMGKFLQKRNKYNNYIESGKWVIVDVQTDEQKGKPKMGYLYYVYDEKDKVELKNMLNEHVVSLLCEHSEKMQGIPTTDDLNLDFIDSNKYDKMKMVEQYQTTISKTSTSANAISAVDEEEYDEDEFDNI